MNKLLFSTIDVTRQAFYRTAHAFAIDNLKPIVPGRELPLRLASIYWILCCLILVLVMQN